MHIKNIILISCLLIPQLGSSAFALTPSAANREKDVAAAFESFWLGRFNDAIPVLKAYSALENGGKSYSVDSATAYLGYAYADGLTFLGRDHAKALEYCQSAKNSYAGKSCLGYLYIRGFGVGKNNDYGISLLEQGSEGSDIGRIEAVYTYSGIYDSKLANPEKALDHAQSIEEDWLRNQTLGDVSISKKSILFDAKKASDYLKKAADSTNSLRAKYRLSSYYSNEAYGEKDLDLAWAMLMEARNNGWSREATGNLEQIEARVRGGEASRSQNDKLTFYLGQPDDNEARNKMALGASIVGGLALLGWLGKQLLGSGSSSGGGTSSSSSSPAPSASCTGSVVDDWTKDNKHYYRFELSKGGKVTYYTEWRRESNASDPLTLSTKGSFHYLYRSDFVGATNLGWRVESSGQSYINGIGDTNTSSPLEALKRAASKSEDCQIR